MNDEKLDHSPDGLVSATPLLLQDENSGRDGRRYNEWHASRPDARLNAREAAQAVMPVAPSDAEILAVLPPKSGIAPSNLEAVRQGLVGAFRPVWTEPAMLEFARAVLALSKTMQTQAVADSIAITEAMGTQVWFDRKDVRRIISALRGAP